MKASTNRLTTEEFVVKARKVHGDRYDYSEVEYVNSNLDVMVICRIHGGYRVKPKNHVSNKNGCPKCRNEKFSMEERLGKEEFLERCKMIHGDRYDYSKADYVNYKTKVTVICREHGEFMITPGNHLVGSKGCQKCAGNTRMDKEEFARKAMTVHGSRYDYSEVRYVNNKTKVKIICKEHGEFFTTPHSHLSLKRGCRLCKESRGEAEIAAWLDEHGIRYERQKTFDGCRNIHVLPFDFYLPDYNLLIEYQGIQHFNECFYSNKSGSLELRRKLDDIKRKYCTDNGILLLEIPYNEDILKSLKEIKIRTQ